MDLARSVISQPVFLYSFLYTYASANDIRKTGILCWFRVQPSTKNYADVFSSLSSKTQTFTMRSPPCPQIL